MTNTKKLLIKTRRQVFSEMVGNNPSPFRGEGYDFFELRPYEVGDDIRHIDWIISAKLHQPHVKVFHREHMMNVVTVSLLDGAFHFGSVRLKTELAAEVVGLLGFSAVKNGDPLTSLIYTDKVHAFRKPGKKLSSVDQAVTDVATFDPIGRQVNGDTFQTDLMRQLRRKSVVFVIGDFFQIPRLDVLARKHDVVAVILRDRLEEELPAFGAAALIDPATSGGFTGSIDKRTSQAYANMVQAQDKELERYLNKHRIRRVKIYTHEEPFPKLARTLAR